MITIYSTDGVKLFTDPKEHYYVDADLLTERAYYTRRNALLNQLAEVLGFRSYDDLVTFTRARGVTHETLTHWIRSGSIADNIQYLEG